MEFNRVNFKSPPVQLGAGNSAPLFPPKVMEEWREAFARGTPDQKENVIATLREWRNPADLIIRGYNVHDESLKFQNELLGFNALDEALDKLNNNRLNLLLTLQYLWEDKKVFSDAPSELQEITEILDNVKENALQACNGSHFLMSYIKLDFLAYVHGALDSKLNEIKLWSTPKPILEEYPREPLDYQKGLILAWCKNEIRHLHSVSSIRVIANVKMTNFQLY